MHVIIGDCGNEAIAAMQWAYEHKLQDVYKIISITGWQGHSWQERIEATKDLAKSYNFNFIKLIPVNNFSQIVLKRGEFPSPKAKWCANFLKALPLLGWLEINDTTAEAVILSPERSQLHPSLADTVEFVENSEYFGFRRLWRPLFKVTLAERDELIKRANFPILPHPSLECAPCINSNNFMANNMPIEDKLKAKTLAQNIGKEDFPYVKSGADIADHTWYYAGCGNNFGCGL